MLDPKATELTGSGMWTEQAFGVGHFAKYAESRLGEADTTSMIVRDQAIIKDVMERLADDYNNLPTSGIAAGTYVVAMLAMLSDSVSRSRGFSGNSVNLRPNWDSWLVKGGLLSGYGGDTCPQHGSSAPGPG